MDFFVYLGSRNGTKVTMKKFIKKSQRLQKTLYQQEMRLQENIADTDIF